jgi:hypothetical protein
MTELSTAEKLRLARVFANAHSENIVLKKVLGRLAFAARTSGGVAGRDDEICAACDEAEKLLLLP